MIRVLTSFLLTAFLFVGIMSTANLLLDFNKTSSKALSVNVVNVESNRITIKEIEKKSAKNNFYFTSKNSVK